ncbi:hypothetical protein DJ533_00050 (plasmid) [Acinetobacter defluvii]|uniref:HTH cro/C1-type domain-containing protein n=1 Tax=Acinetobacter defluvii TaxID=1871111 RepID=A0A2S2F7Z8_9GAMM|nr:hypothetical protein [Acinetobacter defluvii]AWL27111.1 hypothetical protein DJ533_00050 [Acinetobacter defluvii]
MSEIKLPKYDELWTTIGKNCRIAREISGYTRLDVVSMLYAITGDKLKVQLKNLSDLEYGHKTCTFSHLVRLSLLYKCSLNFLTGLSPHIEINLIEKKSVVLGAIESTTTEITERIGERLDEVLNSIPKQRGELLHNTAKRTITAIEKQKNKDLVFSANYPDIANLSKDLSEKVADFEEASRRYYRYAELNLIQQIEDHKQEQLGARLTDCNELEEPERLQANKHELPCDEKFNAMVGYNCKIAREWAGVNRDVVMQKVWNYKEETFNNRIVELETGARSFPLPIMIKIAKLYDCSLDFIAGISNEVELNAPSSHNGIIIQSMRSAALDMANSLSKNLCSLLDHFPKYHGELLKLYCQKLVDAILVHRANREFSEAYPEVLEMAFSLQAEIQAFDMLIARFHRYAELNIIEVIQEYENKAFHKKGKNRRSKASRA